MKVPVSGRTSAQDRAPPNKAVLLQQPVELPIYEDPSTAADHAALLLVDDSSQTLTAGMILNYQ